MKKVFLILIVTIMATTFGSAVFCTRTDKQQIQETTQTSDTMLSRQVHSVIENIFYNLPLEKSRLDLREVIVNDRRFILTDTTFNNFIPSSFFKGITTDKGQIKSNPDSIQVQLIYGDAAMVKEKGGQEDFNKHPMILDFKYFYSNKDSVEMEYVRLLNMVQPIYADTSSIKNDSWQSHYSIGAQKGTQKCIGKIFDSFEPYYRVSISSVSFIPADGSKSVFVLHIGFSKEDK